jgi:hypothetical protein
LNIGGHWKRWVAGYDIHGINQDRSTNRAFFRFVEQWKPHYRICGGDVWDFKQLRKKADAYEKRDSMAQDVAEGQLWLTTFAPTAFLRGNHDERLWDLANESEGIVADYAKLGVKRLEELVASLGCRMFPYNKREGVLHLGSLKFIHGYYTGVTAARRTAFVYGSVVMGHGHGIQSATIEGIEPRAGFMCGCLCKVELQYNRAQPGTLSWENGWCFGVVNERTGSFQYWQARKIDGKWIVPTTLEQV